MNEGGRERRSWGGGGWGGAFPLAAPPDLRVVAVASTCASTQQTYYTDQPQGTRTWHRLAVLHAEDTRPQTQTSWATARHRAISLCPLYMLSLGPAATDIPLNVSWAALDSSPFLSPHSLGFLLSDWLEGTPPSPTSPAAGHSLLARGGLLSYMKPAGKRRCWSHS
jgi:hypothetical protein